MAHFKAGPLEGLIIIEPRPFYDDRGFFMETYKNSEFQQHGITHAFVQDNHSRSHRGVLRGLHFQRSPHEQGKLVRVVRGAVWDVAVDLRPQSPTYKKWYGLEISEDNKILFFIPEGFAHGFVALSDEVDLVYKCTAEYHAPSDGGIRWDDPDIAIDWPVKDVIVSAKDAALPYLASLEGAPL